MTVIAGLIENGEVWIGGDSAGVAGWDLVLRRDPKVFQRGHFLIGFTTSYRMGQLLRYKLEVPAQPAEMSSHEFMVTLFVDGVRECLKEGGYARKVSEAEEAGEFLVGYRDHLYTVCIDYQVCENAENFAAVGCGAAYALGALTVLTHEDASMPPNDKVVWALRAAELWSAGVRGPLHVQRMEIAGRA